MAHHFNQDNSCEYRTQARRVSVLRTYVLHRGRGSIFGICLYTHGYDPVRRSEHHPAQVLSDGTLNCNAESSCLNTFSV